MGYTYAWREQKGKSGDRSRGDGTIKRDLEEGQKPEYNDRVGGYKAFQDPASMNLEQVNDALDLLGNGNYGDAPAGYDWLLKLQTRQQELNSQAAMQEYQGAMLEMYGAMAEASKQAAEAASYVAPYQQPAQQADAASQQSRADSARQQMMRKGLLSLTRFGSGGNNARQTLGVVNQ